MKKKGIGSHHSATSMEDEWLTPPEIIERLGAFDLDPCASIVRPWPMAKKHLTIEDNGLKPEWFGRVWLNPPYGKKAEPFLKKMAIHKNGIVLIFARTETTAFFNHIWDSADAILFIKGRLFFHKVDGTRAKGNGGAPSCLIAYGAENVESLINSGIPGKLVFLK